MAGFSTANTEYLIRTNVWAPDLKRTFEDELLGWKYVRIIDFPDGDTLNIPSIGQMNSRNYVENGQILYDAMDTGNFQFTITEYKSAATYITNKMKQDSFYMSELMSAFVPAMNRALAVDMEVRALAVGPEGQTLASTNSINGASHRFIGSGTNETLSVVDFQRAKFALQKANVPMTNLIAIVDPSVEYALATQTNLVNFSNNPKWEGIVKTGLSTGMRFITNIFGFDVYTSNYLKVNTASEQIGTPTAAAGVNNLFFSAASGAEPFVGAIRQAPKIDSEYNKDFQREEFVVTSRYGIKLFRPENLVVVVTDTDQVA
jgi:hypothetical protein